MRKLFWLFLFSALITCGTVGAQESGPLEHPHMQAPPAQAQPAAPVADPSQKAPSENLIVPSGTRMPLILHNAITTRNAHVGDPVYLETVFPIVIKDRILIPAGTYIQGEIQEAKRPGKVKGVGEIRMRLNSMILPNGYSVDFNAVPTNAGTGGNESTGIGAIASQSGKGAGIGAGVGAAVGLAAVLLTRGPEMELPRGTSLDIVTDRPIYLDSNRITFTDHGRATALPGPGNREPARNNSPF
jgi:type IV secretion system protein VirB10